MTQFHSELLQLDKKQNATNIYQLKEQFATNPKFPWRIMCIKLSEVNLLIGFFRDFVCPKNKSIRNIVDKIEFFDDENQILKEEPTHEDFKKHMLKGSMDMKEKGCSCPCNCFARRIPVEIEQKKRSLSEVDNEESKEKRKIVKYFLFVKPPDVKEIKKPAFIKGDQDVQAKKHILELLKEAETLESLKITIMDQNSLSEIMAAIRQHIEKKKAFGAQDFKYGFVIQSIAQRFSKNVASQGRLEF